MASLIIIFGLLCVVFLIWNILTDDKYERFCSVFILTMSAIVLFILISSYVNRNTPTAKSAYQGKTTLEITYRDSIPVDTIVVYKEEFRK